VNPAESGAHAGVLENQGYAALEIAGAEQDVIEHRRHLILERGDFLPPNRQDASLHEDARGGGEK
jgi:hypothetical protein